MSEQNPVENVQNETPEITLESLQEQLNSVTSQLELERKEKEAKAQQEAKKGKAAF